MNILYLSENDPRQISFGGAQRTHFIWEALKRQHSVYSVFFDYQFNTEEIAPNIWHVKKVLVGNPVRYFFYRLERKLLRPFHVLPYWPIPTKLEKSIDEIFPNMRFDMVVCRYCFDLMEMHLWKFPKIYVDFDDHPIEIYNTLGCKDVSRALRPLGRWIIKLQMYLIQKKIDGGWISNPRQVDMMIGEKRITCLRNIALTPSEKYNVNACRKPWLVIVGAMSYYPNYTGVDKFLNDIWGMVHAKAPNLELLIIGKGTPMDYYKRWEGYPNVRQLGYVDNIESIYEQCLAAVVPIYSGGGTCIKTIEAMAYSRVCLSSRFGARGLDDCFETKMTGLQVFDSVADFLYLLEHYVLNADNRAVAEKAGRCYVKANYSKEVFINTVLSTISE